MKFAEEIVVEEFLPTFRSMLAEGLRDRGLTQNEVAEVLGISQSAVSKYAHGEIARQEVFVEDERVQRIVERLASGLAAEEMSRVEAFSEVQALIRRLEDRDLVCQFHERAMPALEGRGCDICVRGTESAFRAEERVLASVRRGLRILVNASGVAGLLPNVGSNLVECLPDATDVDDVAAVPGRIFDVKGQPAVPGKPEFGVSGHVATVLLTARHSGSPARAAFNLRYEPALIETFVEMGHVAAEFDGEAELDVAIGEALSRAPGATVLYQTGGFGIEPITYVLGEDAESVARATREVLG